MSQADEFEVGDLVVLNNIVAQLEHWHPFVIYKIVSKRANGVGNTHNPHIYGLEPTGVLNRLMPKQNNQFKLQSVRSLNTRNWKKLSLIDLGLLKHDIKDLMRGIAEKLMKEEQ